MKCKYRVRWFSSKGAFLVLLWTLLVFIVCGSFHELLPPDLDVRDLVDHSNSLRWLYLCPLFVALLSAPLSGWLADAKFGNYKVFRAGAVLLFISMVINCLLLILEAFVESIHVLKWVHLCLCTGLFVVGACACVVTALPLGLDQMPDASSSNITSYIAWFVCSLFVGGFLGQSLNLLKRRCLNERMQSSYSLIWALFLPLCMSLVLISNFLFSPKWLIIEPKSLQSLKTIYRVLKFAAKHKAPLNRSAFTYWEEDIPSRIDLGKSKYGGPFTTEQVEDIKTILRLLAISLPFSFIVFSLFFPINAVKFKGEDFVNSTLYITTFFVSGSSLYSVLWTIGYEFLVYPLVRNKLPSILKRLGTVPLLMTLVSLVCFTLKLALYLSHSDTTTIEWIAHFLYRSSSGVLFQMSACSLLEFMCAQSPYNMRGLLLSSVIPIVFFSGAIGSVIGYFLQDKICTQSWCLLIPFSVKTVLCSIGFLLFCVVAHWYKKRVRDEDYSPQRVVEEVYDRYLTAAAAQSRWYGTSD